MTWMLGSLFLSIQTPRGEERNDDLEECVEILGGELIAKSPSLVTIG